MSYQNICYIIVYYVALQCKYCTMIYCIVLQCVILWYIFVYTMILWVSILSILDYILLCYSILYQVVVYQIMFYGVVLKANIAQNIIWPVWLFSNSIVLFELHHGSSNDSHITNVFDNGRGYLTTAPPPKTKEPSRHCTVGSSQVFLSLELLHAWFSTYSEIK